MEIGGRNLIISNNAVDGYVNSTGSVSGSDGYKATDYIPVTPGDILIFQLWSPIVARVWIDDTYFDSDKNYVTGYDGSWYDAKMHYVIKVIVPNNAAYVRFSYTWNNTFKYKLEKGNKATDWTPAPEDVEEGYKNYTDDAVGDATVTITESYESLIEETAKQINLMIQQLTEITNSQGTSISTISNQLQLTTEMAQFVKTTTKQLQDVVDGKVSAEEIQEWARFDGATLELGASNQPFKAKLTTTELAFFQGNNKVAWISNNELHILTAIITQSIGVGNFMFIDEGDLGFSLV